MHFRHGTINKILPVVIGFLVMLNFSVSLDAEKEKNLLDLSLEELMNVKITTAARTPQKIGDIPASVVLITRKDIETYGYTNLREILENIPGLYAIDDLGEDGVNFGVRGFWSGVANDNMIILVDGVPQVYDIHSNYPLSKITVPMESIDKIEVIRGPMSVIYGHGAFFGVINIFTNQFSTPGHESSIEENVTPVSLVSTSLGSAQSKKFTVRTAGKINEFNYVFNASLYDTYGMDQPLSKMVRDPSLLPLSEIGVDNDDTGGRLENNEKYFNFSGNFKGFYTNLSYNESKKEFYYLMPSFSSGNLNINNTTNVSFGYRKKFSSTFSIDGKFTYFQTRFNQIYDFLMDGFFGHQQLETNAWEFEFDTFLNPSKNIEITAGLQYRSIIDANTVYDLPSFGAPSLENNYLFLSPDSNIDTRALFAQANYKPFSNLRIVAGIRFEQMPAYLLGAELAGGTSDSVITGEIEYKQDEIEVIPRLAAIFSLDGNHFLKLLYGQAINRPSFFQNSVNLLLEAKKGGFLEPESIHTLELNYIGSFSPNFTLSASIFRNIAKNLITRFGELDKVTKEYITWSDNATDPVTTIGTELTLNIEPIQNLRIELSGTYQETKNKREGHENKTVPYSPKFLGYLKAAYRISGFSLAVTGNYVGAMETYWDESINGGYRIGDKVAGYFVLGANLRVENLFVNGLYFNIRGSNLLNEEIRYPTFTNNQWADRGTLGFGRTFMFTLGYKF